MFRPRSIQTSVLGWAATHSNGHYESPEGYKRYGEEAMNLIDFKIIQGNTVRIRDLTDVFGVLVLKGVFTRNLYIYIYMYIDIE